MPQLKRVGAIIIKPVKNLLGFFQFHKLVIIKSAVTTDITDAKTNPVLLFKAIIFNYFFDLLH